MFNLSCVPNPKMLATMWAPFLATLKKLLYLPRSLCRRYL